MKELLKYYKRDTKHYEHSLDGGSKKDVLSENGTTPTASSCSLPYSDSGHSSICEKVAKPLNCDLTILYETKLSNVKIELQNIDDTAKSWHGESVTTCLIRLYEKGIDQYSSGDYIKAKSTLSETLHIVQIKFPQHKKILSKILFDKGKVLFHLGEYVSSAQDFLTCHKMLLSDNAKNQNLKEVIRLLYGVIEIEKNRDNHDSEVELEASIVQYTRIVQIGNLILGKDHLDVATANHKLGELYCNKERFSSAISCFKSALKVRLALLTDHHDVVSLLFSIGRAYYEKEQYESALKYIDSSLAMDKRLLGSNHPDLVSTYIIIGHIYLHLSRVDDSLCALSRAYSLRKNSYDNIHNFRSINPELASILFRMGISYTLKNDLISAEQVYMERLNLQKSYLSPQHSEIAETWRILGRIHYKRKQYSNAIHDFLQELSIKRKCLGKDHLEVANALNDIGDIYEHHLCDLNSALNVYQEALRIELKHNPSDGASLRKAPNSSNVESIKTKIGHVLFKTGKVDEANSILPISESVRDSYDSCSRLRLEQKFDPAILPSGLRLHGLSFRSI